MTAFWILTNHANRNWFRVKGEHRWTCDWSLGNTLMLTSPTPPHHNTTRDEDVSYLSFLTRADDDLKTRGQSIWAAGISNKDAQHTCRISLFQEFAWVVSNSTHYWIQINGKLVFIKYPSPCVKLYGWNQTGGRSGERGLSAADYLEGNTH